MGFTGEDNLFATVIRRINFILAIFSIFIGIYINIYQRHLTKNSALLILFYILYYFVVYYDLYYTDIASIYFNNKEKELILIRMSRLVLIPVIASLIIRIEGFKNIRLIIAICWSLFVSLILALFVLNISFGSSVAERMEIEGELNSLNMGYWSATLFLLLVYLFFQFKNKIKFIPYLPALLLSLYLMVAAGSRGPLIYSFIIVYYYFSFVEVGKIYKRVGNVISFIVVLIVIIDYTVVTDIIGMYNSDLQERLISSVENQEISGRDRIYITALNQFVESPIFGSFFVLETGWYKGQYPHNILIEALITFGLLGAIPFFIFIYKTLKRTHFLIKKNHRMSWLGLIFLISFFKGLSTWTLYGNTLLWMSMFVILTFNLKEIKSKS